MKKNCQTLGLTVLLGVIMTVQGNLNAQTVNIKMGKGWSYITGAQRAVNDSNRVNYSTDGSYPCGRRITNFENSELIDGHDSDFVKVHLDAKQVYDAEKTVNGPAFFISQYEVTNGQYIQFIEDCIVQWMKENRPEIVQKYKWESPEYVQAVQGWLASNEGTTAADGAIQSAHLQSPAANWGELYLKKLDWKKITFRGVAIYPSTEAWVKDFVYSVNEPLTRYYLSHPKYADYPVVCVSQSQAKCFCEWYANKNLVQTKSRKDNYVIMYRLPTEQEWERAASVVAEKRSKKSSGSPANNNYLRNSRGCYIANFRPETHNFGTDGAVYPNSVDSYFPNDAGCYNMQGNVAEWTSTPMNYAVVMSDGQKSAPGYIVKGGAWNLPEAACTVGSRAVFSEDVAKSFVGFRIVAVPMKKFKPLINPEF